MSGYEMFSDYYDLLTGDVDYNKKSRYLLSLFEKHDKKPTLLLDMACGTGGFSLELCKSGIDVIGVDPSAGMLSYAKAKSEEENKEILFLCQSASELELYGTVNGAVCCLDSLNHIIDYDELCHSLERISLFMQPQSLFIFDVNTPYKHREILADNTFVYDMDEVYLVWQNELYENDIVDISLDFFCPDKKGGYSRFSEYFSERAYTMDEISAALSAAGFKFEAVYGDYNYEKPKDDEQRFVIVVRKINDIVWKSK